MFILKGHSQIFSLRYFVGVLYKFEYQAELFIAKIKKTTGRPKKIVHSDLFTPWHDNELLQQQDSTSLPIFGERKNQNTSIITPANTNTIAFTIKNTKKKL